MLDHSGFYRPRSRGPSWTSVMLAAFGLASLAWVVLAQSRRDMSVEAEPRPVAPRADLTSDEQATIEIFERASNSVVYVSPIARVRRDFFSMDLTEVQVGTGTGFIWDEQGHIVTNYHVVAAGSGWKVSLHNGDVYTAELVGALEDKDIAVLRIDAPPGHLHPILVGTSHDLRVGQKVLAIGNPFGLDYSLSTGVVSALDREFPSMTRRTIYGVIQTDAAINPGNSGGPLLDSAGRLIGMNTAIYSETGQSAGIGFAVPVDTINDVVPQLIAYGKVKRPGLGVRVYADRIIRMNRLPGVLIRSVNADSMAAKAGLRGTVEKPNGEIELGDIIVKVDDTPTPNNLKLADSLDRHKVGDEVTLTVIRDDQPMTLKVTLQPVYD